MESRNKTENKKIYDNISMVSPEGLHMCFIGKKRANWYLKRGLAIPTGDKAIQLTFQPNGLGHYYDIHRNVPMKNQCVVCGNTKISELSRHHCVPECFRKHFPDRWKSYRSHEILFLCIKCHNRYEIEATKVKKVLVAPYGGDEIVSSFREIINNILTLLRYGDIMPPERSSRLIKKIKEYFSLNEINSAILRDLLELQPPNPYKSVAQNVTNHYEFSKFWKQHFVDIMKPKYLPSYWKPEYEPVYQAHEV